MSGTALGTAVLDGFCQDSHDPQRMDPNVASNPMIFFSPSGANLMIAPLCFFSKKCFLIMFLWFQHDVYTLIIE